jgi:hypothetical protein
MASDVIDLLRSCNAWVDPNLMALIPSSTNQDEGISKRKRRKREKSNANGSDAIGDNSPNAKKMKNSDADAGDVIRDSEDEFPDLVPNRIVLKRASHVPLSGSEDDDTT